MTESKQPDYRALLQRSLVAIERLEAKAAAAERAKVEPIAVVGMACRFPGGANDLDSYWSLLLAGQDAVTVVPRDRWDAEAIYSPDPDAAGKSYTKWGAFLDQVADFDAAFFGISPREAVNLDPQQRLLLEVVWESLEHAGIAPSSLNGTQGSVYLGISTGDYADLMHDSPGGKRRGDAYAASGLAHSIASGRLSYFLGMQGPNLAVDTACSSSVVAIHSAINALRNGETGLALAGGVNLTVTDLGAILTSRARMMSFDGHCKTFDESADGYVRGEGCGMVVLKRLSDAQRDGDRVLALMRGSAINQDGRSSGLTAPNGIAQEAVIRTALTNAQLQPDDIDVLEAHGTGTPLGDPIEMKALGNVFGNRPSDRPLLVGSVKTNIGHLEAASGVAGIIKTILAMQHGLVPPHLHFKHPNKLIPWDALPVSIPVEATPWPDQPGKPRRAGLSSFGFSGTNSHVVIEQAPQAEPVTDIAQNSSEQLVVLSAQTIPALRELAGRFAARLDASDAPALADVAYTAACGRSHLSERLSFVASNSREAASHLQRWIDDPEATGISQGRFASGTQREIAFLFSGQGAQFPGMARELFTSEPVFRQALEACATVVDSLLPLPLLSVIFGDATDSLDDTAYTQPALFAVEYALAALWKSWGVEPAVVAGHSVGEYVAACVAGVFSMRDGMRLITERGRLMSALPRNGSMVAVFASHSRVAAMLENFASDVDIAAVNGPENIVISGSASTINAILAELTTSGIDFARLNVSHAFHSPLMEPMLEAFGRFAETIQLTTPAIGMISNVTGRMAGAEVATSGYWVRHVREAVQFEACIATLHSENVRTFLELGPSPVLLGMAQRCANASQALWLSSLRKGRGDRATMLECAQNLYATGQSFVWSAVCDKRARRVTLPSYPFQRERYWLDNINPHAASVALEGQSTGHPLLGQRISSPIPLFQSALSVASIAWLSEHRIYEEALLPAAGFLELATAAARNVFRTSDVRLADVSILAGLTVPESGNVRMQVVVTPTENGAQTIRVFSSSTTEGAANSPDEDWVLHLSAVAIAGLAERPAAGLRSLPAALRVEHDVAAYYRTLLHHGVNYGPAFSGITRIETADSAVLGHIRLPESLSAANDQYVVHPGLLDSCLQLIGLGLPWANDPRSADDICVPIGLAGYSVYRSAPTDVWCHVTSIRANANASGVVCDCILTDSDGEIVATVDGLEMHRVTRASLRKPSEKSQRPDWLLELKWQESPEPVHAAALTDRWLLISDDRTLAASVAAQLTERGARVSVAQHGNDFAKSPLGWQINLRDAAQFEQLFTEARALDEVPFQRIAVLVGTASNAGNDTTDDFASEHQFRISTLLAALPHITESDARLFIVTRGALAVENAAPSLLSAPVSGLSNVIATEYPSLRSTQIDLGRATRSNDAAALVSALVADDSEFRVALRHGVRYVARLSQGELVSRAAHQTVRLEIAERGTLENLRLETVQRENPGADQVEIRVHATGLNFRDVLNALGMYPGDPGPLGNECAGVITAVGENVADLVVGDEVVAMIDRSFATYALANAMSVVRKPANLSFVEAATIPVTFLTAEYALTHLAHIKRGDKVLIHAATGGVGMAAIQLSKRKGAEIYGTAGTPAKRAMAMELGAHHVADSRSLSFAEDFTTASHEGGMDIVLNSLAGDFIPTSLGLLKKGGHFIEIGKTGIWNADAVADAFPGICYHPLYLGEITAADPAFMRDMLQRLMDDFASGELRPLPVTLYPLAQAEAAFRFMSQGLHTGKIVLEQPRTPEVRDDATYLITGGVGGLGLETARWLARLGARSIVLVSRRAPSDNARAQIDALRTSGARITVVACDVSVERDVAQLLEQIHASLPPLRGILHAAGTVDDAMLSEQTLDRFRRVMAPKVAGSWHLHQLTHHLSLDFFVMFSSGAALLGSPGQSNYAAANSFMDALAFVRRAEGRHALSVNWGSWSEVGMASELNEQHRQRWAAQGLAMIAPDEGVRMLEAALFGSESPNVAALPIIRSKLPPNAGRFYERLVTQAANRSPAATANADVLARLVQTPADARAGVLIAFLTEQVVRVLALPSAARARPDQSLMDIGMDSLTAMELRNRVQSALQIRLSVADLLRGPTINELSSQLLGELDFEAGIAVVTASGPEWEEGSL